MIKKVKNTVAWKTTGKFNEIEFQKNSGSKKQLGEKTTDCLSNGRAVISIQ